jgi:acyl-CoA reductase-like NAD-dependent aldehyde dehydrogenase
MREDAGQVRATVAAARAAAEGWAALPVAVRAARVGAVGRALLEATETLAGLVHEETGWPLAEVFVTEVVSVLDVFEHLARHGPDALAPRPGRVPALELPGKSAVVERLPLGVVGVIAPATSPVAFFCRVAAPALLAGNAVVLKPSELTPRTGAALAAAVADVLGPLVACVSGGPEVGEALVDTADHVVVGGHTATGRAVAARAAARGIGYDLVLAGKDAAVILDDALLDRAATAVAWGIVRHGGQDGASLTRVLVHRAIHEPFLALLAQKLEHAGAVVADVTSPSARQRAHAAVTAAIAAGATVLAGRVPAAADEPLGPLLLGGVPRAAGAWADEVEGPVAVVEVHDDEDALVDAVHASRFARGACVWGEGVARATEVAHRLRVGTVSVNNTALAASLPDLPWSGGGDSGPGVLGAAEALARLTRPRVVLVDRGAALEPWWTPYDDSLLAWARAAVEVRKATTRVGRALAMARLMLAGRRRRDAQARA